MTEDSIFEKTDFRTGMTDTEYCGCTFTGCNFSDTALTDIMFDNCTFRGCNFSLTRFRNLMADCTFTECKMTGADFADASKFSRGLRFDKSILDYCSFMELKLKKTMFVECSIREAYFDKADITGSVFDRCDLERTSFSASNLEKVDFSSSFNFSINPSMCRLKKTVFSEFGLRGLVQHLDIVIKD